MPLSDAYRAVKWEEPIDFALYRAGETGAVKAVADLVPAGSLLHESDRGRGHGVAGLINRMSCDMGRYGALFLAPAAGAPARNSMESSESSRSLDDFATRYVTPDL